MGPLRDNQTRIRAQHQEHLDWFKGLIDTNQVSLNVIKEYDNRLEKLMILVQIWMKKNNGPEPRHFE
jgi:hypothetical protein